MRIKDGKIQLSSSEKRFGNYVLKKEDLHMKLMDINETFIHKFSLRTPMGMMLLGAWNGDNEGFVRNYAAFLSVICATVPDVDYIRTVYDMSRDCMGRHPELYGQKPESDQAHQEAMEEVRDTEEFLGKVMEGQE